MLKSDLLDDMGMTGVTSGTHFGTNGSQTQVVVETGDPFGVGSSGTVGSTPVRIRQARYLASDIGRVHLPLSATAPSANAKGKGEELVRAKSKNGEVLRLSSAMGRSGYRLLGVAAAAGGVAVIRFGLWLAPLWESIIFGGDLGLLATLRNVGILTACGLVGVRLYSVAESCFRNAGRLSKKYEEGSRRRRQGEPVFENW